MTNWQNVKNSVLHTAVQGTVWLAPVFLLAYPEMGKLTISAVIGIVVAFLNNKYLSNS